MKVKNKRMFIRGVLFILFGAVIAAVRFLIFSHNVHGILKPILVIGLCLFIGVVHVALAFRDGSRKESKEGGTQV